MCNGPTCISEDMSDGFFDTFGRFMRKAIKGMEHGICATCFVMDLYPSRLSFTGPSEMAVTYFVMNAILEHNGSENGGHHGIVFLTDGFEDFKSGTNHNRP